MFDRIRSIAFLAALIGALAAALPAQAATTVAAGLLPPAVTGPDQAVVGQTITLSLGVTNTSTTPMTSVQIGAFWASANAKMVGALPNPDTCARFGGVGGLAHGFGCSVAAIQPGESVSIPLVLQPIAVGTLVVEATASGSVDGVFQNGSTLVNITVAPAPTDVQINGSASTGSPAPGASFSYKFQVKNSGGQPAYGVTFSDTVPSAATLVAATSSPTSTCTIAGATATCALGDLPVGGQVTISLGAIAPTAPQILVDTASASATNADTNPANNSVSITLQVK